MSIETPKNLTELHAQSMARNCGIELTSKQIARYVEFRQGDFSGHPESNDLSVPIFNLSDQRLLDIILTEEQRVVFRSHYSSIFDLDISKQKLYPTFERKIRV